MRFVAQLLKQGQLRTLYGPAARSLLGASVLLTLFCAARTIAIQSGWEWVVAAVAAACGVANGAALSRDIAPSFLQALRYYGIRATQRSLVYLVMGAPSVVVQVFALAVLFELPPGATAAPLVSATAVDALVTALFCHLVVDGVSARRGLRVPSLSRVRYPATRRRALVWAHLSGGRWLGAAANLAVALVVSAFLGQVGRSTALAAHLTAATALAGLLTVVGRAASSPEGRFFARRFEMSPGELVSALPPLALVTVLAGALVGG